MIFQANLVEFLLIRFDLQNSNVSDSSLDQYNLDELADVVS
jgi:hypothetical protein